LYRFGFNGKENDNEVHGAVGTFQDYGMRAYDTRVGRFFSVDPLTKQYPWYSPYQFAGNKPTWATDLDGEEEFVLQARQFTNSYGETVIYRMDYQHVRLIQRAVTVEGTFVNGPVANYSDRDAFRRDDSRGRIQFDPTNPAYVIARQQWVRNGGRPGNRGEWNMEYIGHLKYAPDQGRTVGQVREHFDQMSGQDKRMFDNAVRLLEVTNASMEVTGLASPKATNIDGTESLTTQENNLTLANQRANTMRDFILQYASDQGIAVDPSRVVVNGTQVRSSGGADASPTDQGTLINIRQ